MKDFYNINLCHKILFFFQKGFVSGGPSEGSASDCDLGLEGEGREVRYTDQEYEDDSSDCEDVLLNVPSLPGCKFFSKIYNLYIQITI